MAQTERWKVVSRTKSYAKQAGVGAKWYFPRFYKTEEEARAAMVEMQAQANRTYGGMTPPAGRLEFKLTHEKIEIISEEVIL